MLRAHASRLSSGASEILTAGCWPWKLACGHSGIQLNGQYDFLLRCFSSSLLCNTSSYLRNLENGAEIFLVGTAHVSKKSAEEVQQTISVVKPDVVMVELCEARALKLMRNEDDGMGGFGNMMQLLKQLFYSKNAAGFGAPGMAATEGFLKGLYKYMKMMGLSPGLEFKVAMEEAQKRGASLIYGDQPFQTTVQRLSESVSFSTLMKMMTSPMVTAPSLEVQQLFSTMNDIESIVEGIKKRSVVASMQKWLEEVHPGIVKALIHDRDQYMVERLLELNGRVVAVVGLGHLDGIERRWEKMQRSRQIAQ